MNHSILPSPVYTEISNLRYSDPTVNICYACFVTYLLSVRPSVHPTIYVIFIHLEQSEAHDFEIFFFFFWVSPLSLQTVSEVPLMSPEGSKTQGGLAAPGHLG